jgi:hypothetical protein
LFIWISRFAAAEGDMTTHLDFSGIDGPFNCTEVSLLLSLNEIKIHSPFLAVLPFTAELTYLSLQSVLVGLTADRANWIQSQIQRRREFDPSEPSSKG